MQSIDTQKLQSMKSGDADFLLINTLEGEHFDDTRIPGAINIPQSQGNFVDEVTRSAQDKAQPIVVYCASEDCASSTKAAKKLEEAGFSNVLDYEGGARAWQNAGHALAG